MIISPEVGVSKSLMSLIKVDFPAPFLPRRPTILPRGISRLMFFENFGMAERFVEIPTNE